VTPASKSVLVTGASSGIGRATVAQLVADGWRVFAGLRNCDAGSGQPPDGAVPLRLDVTDSEQIGEAVSAIAGRTGGTLDGVVHSAGIPVGGALEEVEAAELRQIFEVNVFAPVLLTQALLPMLRRVGGRVVILGSLGGRVAFPFAGPYHATKFALEALADSLRLELRPQGVGVAIIEPSAIATPIWSSARRQVSSQRNRLGDEGRELYEDRLAAFEAKLASAERHGEDPAKVAAKIAAALEGSGARYPVGRGAGTISRLRPLLPEFAFDRLVGTRLG
jgi:NAD(P)-dependent dehydrogenase (short-subunit alcohol dehydrogenase family)